MQYTINIPDDEFFTHGVVVYETLDGRGYKALRVQGMGESSTWDKIGLLRSGVLKEEGRLSRAFFSNDT